MNPNLSRRPSIPPMQPVQYDSRRANLFEQPGSQMVFNTAPGDPDFLIVGQDRQGVDHIFYGKPGLGIIDLTESKRTGRAQVVARLGPVDSTSTPGRYDIPIAGPAPDRMSRQWYPFEHPGGGIPSSAAPAANRAFKVKRVVVDGGLGVGTGARDMEKADPFPEAARRFGEIMKQERDSELHALPDAWYSVGAKALAAAGVRR